MEEKKFDDWIKVKTNLHNGHKIQNINEGEIWWVGVGENVGVEINGKSEYFSRPVFIFKKLSRQGFMGIPLTSQKHKGSWYVQFRFQNKDQFAALAQARVISTFRLYKRIGRADEKDVEKIKEAFKKLYLD